MASLYQSASAFQLNQHSASATSLYPEDADNGETAVVINTARGGIVNESALLIALENNSIAGAATDVLTVEPPPAEHHMLVHSLDNLIITPHIAWASVEARMRLLNKVKDNINSYFNAL